MHIKQFVTIILFPLVVHCSIEIPKVLLNNGARIPILGLGTYLAKAAEAVKAIKDAIDVGYRHFDCAYSYENEKEIGQAIAEKIAEGVVKREDLFITSKLWSTFHKPEAVEGALNITLRDLRLEYVDLYLIHFPIGLKEDGIAYSDDDYVDTWIAMEKLYTKGLAKSIGISNFNKTQIERILEHAAVVPVTNQVECHPHLSEKKLIEFCKSKNITVTAHSSLGSTLMNDPTITAIASKLQKTPAQILLRYPVQRDVIVIPKSVNKYRMIENSKIFDFELSAGDMEAIDNLNLSRRKHMVYEWAQHKYYPFRD